MEITNGYKTPIHIYYIRSKRIEDFESKLEKGQIYKLKTFVGSKWVFRTASIDNSELMRHEVKEENESIKVTEPEYEKELKKNEEDKRVKKA